MFERLESVFGGAGLPDGDISIAQLQKALVATGTAAGLGSTGYRSLVYEDLETSLKAITFGEAQFTNTLWNRLKANPVEAKSLYHEYIQLTSYGTRSGIFSPEQGSATTKDTSMKRAYATVAFMRDKRQWSHVSDFVDAIESPEKLQVLGSTMFLIEQLERYLYEGNPSVVSSEFKGLATILQEGIADTDPKTAVSSDHIIDLAGTDITSSTTCRDTLNTAALVMAQSGSYGVPSDLFMPLAVQKGIDEVLTGTLERIIQPHGGLTSPAANFPNVENNGIIIGSPVSAYRSSFGNIAFRPNYFFGINKEVPTAATGGPLSPNTPTCTGAASAGSGMPAGVYTYSVTGENASGESAVCEDVAVTTSSTDLQVTLTIHKGATDYTDAQGNTNATTGYRIYRTAKGGTVKELIDRIPCSGSGTTPNGNSWSTSGDHQLFVDVNGRMTGTHDAYLVDMVSAGPRRTLGWAQLAPMGRYNLPMLDSTFQFMTFLYGALLCYNPRKIVRIKNIAV